MKYSIALLCVLLYTTVSNAYQQQDQKLTAYDVLEQYDFPVGLLPQGATGYELNTKTGQFSAYLNGTCSFSIESYELKYKSTIKGVISKGRLAKLKGVSVKVALLWLNIVEVTRDSDELQFSVGIASADFPVNNFLQSPQCGCGFACNNSQENNGDVVSSI
ncbi:hypothetical protein PIB30_003398 [Stylosanthes scabra]|uniref:DUF538 family protein n=1 Tax=Stylosanthes scabra TaxID=79078 RepID=A0ABU6U3G0_9FABA|nr:hypothetical protein [Stylosanthes scabra]